MQKDDKENQDFYNLIKYGRVSKESEQKKEILRVRHLMTKEVFCLHDQDTLRSVEVIMELKRIRHIPIVNDQQKVVGLVTHRDLIESAISKLVKVDDKRKEELTRGIPIAQIMQQQLACVSPETTLEEAANIMEKHQYGCLIVTEDEKLAGIITSTDFLKFFTQWDLFLN